MFFKKPIFIKSKCKIRQSILKGKIKNIIPEKLSENHQSYLYKLNNIMPQLSESTYITLKIEILMRMIAERNPKVREKVKEIAKNQRNKFYYDCPPSVLLKSLSSVFEDIFNINNIELSIKIRNKLFHGDFIGLMNVLGIKPKSRTFINLEKGDICESLIAMQRNNVFKEVNKELLKTIEMLEKLFLDSEINY